MALANRKQSKDHKTHTRSKSANQLSTKSHSSSMVSSSGSASSAASKSSSGSSNNRRPDQYILQSSSSVIPAATPYTQYTPVIAPIYPAANNNGAQHCRSQSVNDIPPPVIAALAKSASNSPQIHGHHHKAYGFPRAESFSFSSHSNLTRAPLVSKEEL